MANGATLNVNYFSGGTENSPVTSGTYLGTSLTEDQKKGIQHITSQSGDYDGNFNSDSGTASGLADYNNGTFINITRRGYTVPSGAEWRRKDDQSKTCSQTIASTKQIATNFGITDFNVKAYLNIEVNWQPNTYTIKYDGNGATGGATENSIHTYDINKKLTKNGYVKTGYTFLGWSTSKTATSATYTNQQSVKNLATSGTKTLYAIWKGGTHTITFNANGGTTLQDSLTPTFGTMDFSSWELLKYTHRAGYKFLGYYDQDDNQVYDANGLYVSGIYWDSNGNWKYNGSITAYAKWELWGVVKIYTEDGWKNAVPYIYTEDNWRQAIPYIFNGVSWKECH